MPIPNVSRSRFFLSLQALRKLGIIAKYGIRGHLITCYPRNYIDDKERLINSLKQDKQRGLPLLASIEEAILHYMNHVEYFSAKVAKGPKLRVVEKVENT